MRKLQDKLILAFVFLLPVVALADGIEVPEGDPLATLLNLVVNFKTLGVLGIASAVTVLVAQGIKKFVPEYNNSAVAKGVVVLMGVVWAIIGKVMTGVGAVEASALVLFTMGGASVIYDYILKPLLAPKA